MVVETLAREEEEEERSWRDRATACSVLQELRSQQDTRPPGAHGRVLLRANGMDMEEEVAVQAAEEEDERMRSQMEAAEMEEEEAATV